MELVVRALLSLQKASGVAKRSLLPLSQVGAVFPCVLLFCWCEEAVEIPMSSGETLRRLLVGVVI
jgi:hypothetical protein